MPRQVKEEWEKFMSVIKPTRRQFLAAVVVVPTAASLSVAAVATSPLPGDKTPLPDYEEVWLNNTWTPTLGSQHTHQINTVPLRYIRVGRVVTVYTPSDTRCYHLAE